MNKTTHVTAYPTVTEPYAITAITPLNKCTFKIELEAPIGQILRYHAGQYLQLEMKLNTNGKPYPLLYSIANSFNPKQPQRLQVFIENRSDFTHQVLEHLSEHKKSNTRIKVTMPMGKAYLQTQLDLPHLLITSGSGMSKIKCIAEDILKQQPDTELNIYWSNKHVDDFYLLAEFQSWVQRYKNVNFVAIVESSSELVHSNRTYRSGYIYQVIQEDFKSLNNVMVYLCGSPKMVYGTIDQLKNKGLREEACFSDVFEYAPRKQEAAI